MPSILRPRVVCRLLIEQAEAFDNAIDDIINKLRGGRENTEIPPPTIAQRVQLVSGGIRLATVKPTQTQVEQYDIASSEFKPVQAKLKTLVDVDLPKFEKQLEDAGAPLVLTRGPLPASTNEDVDEDGGDGELGGFTR